MRKRACGDMDGRGGCCIARYAGGAYDMSKMDRIMLKFRPIAPKPTTAGSGSGGSSPEISEASPRYGRGKRRYNTTNSNKGKRCTGSRKRKSSSEEKVEEVVTLALLPENPERKYSPARESQVDLLSKNMPTWLSFGINEKDHHNQTLTPGCFGMPADRTAMMPHLMRAVGSSVIVECITDAWVDMDGLGRTDEERRMNLGRDTCPGFISDGFRRITWTNGAYRKMVGHCDEGGEIMVWLVMKDKLPMEVTVSCRRAFTCRVRVQYHRASANGKEKSSTTVPCDVWRMDGGCFAWRLDVKAALCLGR